MGMHYVPQQWSITRAFTLFNLSSHCPIYIVVVSTLSVGETMRLEIWERPLACKMFTSGICPWLNVAYLN